VEAGRLLAHRGRGLRRDDVEALRGEPRRVASGAGADVEGQPAALGQQVGEPRVQTLRPIYTAPSAEAAAQALEEFERRPWGQRFPTVVAAWRRAWDRVIPFFAFPPAVRRVIYTTNAIESIHRQLRKIIKTRGHFPSDDAASELIWLALRNITADWGRAAKEWREAMNQFAIAYGDRFTQRAV
jgi:transposase-like protein